MVRTRDGRTAIRRLFPASSNLVRLKRAPVSDKAKRPSCPANIDLHHIGHRRARHKCMGLPGAGSVTFGTMPEIGARTAQWGSGTATQHVMNGLLSAERYPPALRRKVGGHYSRTGLPQEIAALLTCLSRFRNQEILQFPATLKSSGHPSWLQSSAGPGFRWIIVITIFWSNHTARSGANPWA
jgi:hypothetical protein